MVNATYSSPGKGLTARGPGAQNLRTTDEYVVAIQGPV